MSTKVKISCPTCDKKIGGVEDSSRYYYQDFDDMIELFGLTRSGKSQKQCKECFEAGKEYDRSQSDRKMEISCMFCDKKVANLVDAKTEFGFVDGEFRPRESCRECRRGDKNDSINDILDDVIIDNYDSGRRRTRIVVTGNTYDFHEAFKEFGGRFVRDLEDRKGAGWVFKIKKRGGLISLLQKEKKQAEDFEKEKTGCKKCGEKQEDYGLYLICTKCGHLEHKEIE